MAEESRRYRYVGPLEFLAAVHPGNQEYPIGSVGDVAAWPATRSRDELGGPFTFVVDLTGVLRLAPHRSEHVACAGGAAVLSAGEIAFTEHDGRWVVTEASNQSTGYCPDLSSWAAVQRVLDRASLVHPGGFTHPIVFRRCPACRERNVVKDDHFVCALRDEELPRSWNFDRGDAGPG